MTEVCSSTKRFGRFKTLNSSFSRGRFPNWTIELSITIIQAIHWLEWEKLFRINRQMWGVFLISSRFFQTIMDAIRTNKKYLNHMQMVCRGVHQLGYIVSVCVGADRMMSKYNVVDFVNTRVPMAWVDKLIMVSVVFIEEKFCNLPEGIEKFCLSLGKRRDRFRQQSEFKVLGGQTVDWEE